MIVFFVFASFFSFMCDAGDPSNNFLSSDNNHNGDRAPLMSALQKPEHKQIPIKNLNELQLRQLVGELLERIKILELQNFHQTQQLVEIKKLCELKGMGNFPQSVMQGPALPMTPVEIVSQEPNNNKQPENIHDQFMVFVPKDYDPTICSLEMGKFSNLKKKLEARRGFLPANYPFSILLIRGLSSKLSGTLLSINQPSKTCNATITGLGFSSIHDLSLATESKNLNASYEQYKKNNLKDLHQKYIDNFQIIDKVINLYNKDFVDGDGNVSKMSGQRKRKKQKINSDVQDIIGSNGGEPETSQQQIIAINSTNNNMMPYTPIPQPMAIDSHNLYDLNPSDAPVFSQFSYLQPSTVPYNAFTIPTNFPQKPETQTVSTELMLYQRSVVPTPTFNLTSGNLTSPLPVQHVQPNQQSGVNNPTDQFFIHSDDEDENNFF